MPEEKKKPETLTIEIKDDPKPATEVKTVDVDDIRAQMASKAGFLGKVFGVDSKVEAKPKEKKGDEDEEEEGGEKEEKEEKEKEGVVAEEFSADVRAEAVLAVKPKKAKVKPVEPVFGVREATEVAARAAAEAVKGAVAPPQKQEEKKQEEAREYPEEFKDQAQMFDYLALVKPEKYGDLKGKLIDFDRKQGKYVAQWQEENPGQDFDPDDEAHAEFFDKNFPDIADDDLDSAKEAIEDAKIDLKAKKVAEREIAPIKQRLEQERQAQVMAQAAPQIEAQEKDLIKEVFNVVAPELGDWTPDQKSLAEVIANNEVEAEFVNAVVTPASEMLETYYRWLIGSEGYEERNPLHKGLATSLDRLEKFIESRPDDEVTRNGRRFAPWGKINQLQPEERAKYWGIGPDEVFQWIKSETIDQAKKGWEKRSKVLEKYVQRKSGNKTVAIASPAQQNSNSRKLLSSSVVTPGDDGAGRGGVGMGSESKKSESGVGLSAFMRGLGFGKTTK